MKVERGTEKVLAPRSFDVCAEVASYWHVDLLTRLFSQVSAGLNVCFSIARLRWYDANVD